MEYADDIYHLPNNGVAVIPKQDGNRLFLVDVIARNPVSFDLLKKELPFANTEVVKFGFSTDWLDIIPTWIPLSMSDDPRFIKGEWNLPEHYRFPATSET